MHDGQKKKAHLPKTIHLTYMNLFINIYYRLKICAFALVNEIKFKSTQH